MVHNIRSHLALMLLSEAEHTHFSIHTHMTDCFIWSIKMVGLCNLAEFWGHSVLLWLLWSSVWLLWLTMWCV